MNNKIFKNYKTLKDYDYYMRLIDAYQKRGEYTEYTIEGCLLDNYIITAPNCKTAIIKETYLNEWASAYNITLYNKIPQKYEKVISLLENDEIEKARKLFFA